MRLLPTFRSTRLGSAVLFVAAAGTVLAQQSQPPAGGWRRASDPPPVTQSTPQSPAAQMPAGIPQSQDPSEPVDRSDSYGQPMPQGQQPMPQGQQPMPPDEMQQPPAAGQQTMRRPGYGLPAQVILRAGTFVTIRTNQPLSSDHNQPGDTFSGTLAQPIVVDGILLANRGQMVYGRVAQAQRAKSDRPSQLGLELVSLTTADGNQIGIKSQLVARQGGRTPGEVQAGTVVGTTAVGAAIGAAAGWGTGAAIGAGAGAAAGIIGVLLTRNHETIVYPETALTFRMETSVAVQTGNSPQAFRYVGPEDYNHPVQTQLGPRPAGPPAPGYYYGAPAPYPYPYPYYPYYWGPSVSVFWGPSFYGRGFVVRRWR